MKPIDDLIQDAKEALPNVTPTPPGLKAQSSVHDLKSRLEWGEPALTILDVRDREAFNQLHILGAMSIPMNEMVERASSSMEADRDIYVYGSSEQETAQAATSLRESGFKNVAELKGGLEAWKAIDGPCEGIEDTKEPGADAYNVVSRINHHMETQKTVFE
ncbi:MAG: rhodanese-like domain-containing protein [Nostocaceae cyanobacterium]|nr:rhodanese-like domain-containing protein [Nostocaceae cyanobacterium]